VSLIGIVFFHLKIQTSIKAFGQMGVDNINFEMQLAKGDTAKISYDSDVKIEIYNFPKNRFGTLVGTIDRRATKTGPEKEGENSKITVRIDFKRSQIQNCLITSEMLKPRFSGVGDITCEKKKIIYLLIDYCRGHFLSN